ncbi:indole-3-glycerol phosphate synthase TrpC [Amphibacillus sp. Q70]|uniref:indole-3-glycerol phosphate synthase TrpC n=1 Tax=Amphibacillus sp. Q70 TaxID=3453416 RepID=UPI003F874BB5
MTILETILLEKEKEVKQLKKDVSLTEQKRLTPIHSFIAQCRKDQSLIIIAEFKRASPSKGIINPDLDPTKQAEQYQALGASMISVLTDQPFFKGSYADLAAVRNTVDLPILNKDFIIDEVQIDRAYRYGADVILLIAASLPEQRLNDLYQYAIKLGLEVLFEVHKPEELTIANRIGAELIGVNNRDLKTFEVDLKVTEQLAQLLDIDRQILVSESGIQTAADVQRLKQAGARAILVGETLMRANDLQATFSDFLK